MPWWPLVKLMVWGVCHGGIKEGTELSSTFHQIREFSESSLFLVVGFITTTQCILESGQFKL